MAALVLGGIGHALELEIQDLPLGGEANEEVQTPVSQPHPEPDWNCLDSRLVGTGLRAIMPNDGPEDPDRVRQMLRTTKALALDTLFVMEGPIGDALASGQLYGVEYDIFPYDDGFKPDWQSGQCLPIQGRLLGVDEEGEPIELGSMYCFDAAQYAQRAFILQAKPHELFLGPVIHTSDIGLRSLVLSGSGNGIWGDVRSNGALKLGGSENVLVDDAIYVSLLDLHGGPIIGGALEFALPAPLEESPHDAAWYQQEAVSTGTSFLGDVTLIGTAGGDLVVEGTLDPVEDTVVYATGSITVEGSGIDASVTLVAQGTVYLACVESSLRGARDDVLAFATSGQTGEGVYLTGSENVLHGSFFVPDMSFRLFGSKNDITGSIRAEKVKVLGGDNRVDDGTRPADPPGAPE